MVEQQLVEAWVRSRDVRAFRTLCERHAGMVFATSQRVLRNHADAEDVTQECFLRLARASGDIRGSLGAWLHRVAVNLCVDHLRSNRARQDREVRYSRERSGAHEITWDELSEHIDTAMNALPEELRAALIAHYIEGRTHQELADEAGVSRSAITQRMQRALGQVREHLAGRGLIMALAGLTALLEAHAASASPTLPAGLLDRLVKIPVYTAATAGTGTGALSLVFSWKFALALGVAGLIAGGVAWRVMYSPAPSASDSTSNIASEPASTPSPALPPPVSGEAPVVASAVDGQALAAAPAVEPGAVIEGVVREERSGRPLEGVGLVCPVDDDATNFSYGTDDISRTDSAGRYRFDHLAPGAYKVYCIERWETRDPATNESYFVELRFKGNMKTQRVEIHADETQSAAAFEVILGETVRGRVVDPGGAPVADAYVLMRAMGSSVYLDVNTRADGTFVAGGFPLTDKLYLHAMDGRASSSFGEEGGKRIVLPPEDNVRVSGPVGPMTIAEGGLRDVVLTVKAGGSIAGVLLDHQGRPLPAAPIMARSTAPEYLDSRFELTGDHGEFLLAGLAPGTFDVAWNRPDSDAKKDPGWSPSEAEVLQQVELKDAGRVEGLVLRAAAPAAPGLTISGRVVDTRGKAVGSARVETMEAGKNTTTTTGEDGRFALAGLAEKNYFLIVNHADFSTAMENMSAIPSGTSGVEIVLEDLGVVEGRVLDADTRQPATRFSISVRSGRGEPRLVQDEEGRFRVERVCAGANAVIASAEGYMDSRSEITVAGGQTLSGVEVLLERGSELRGRVVTASGSPIEGACLYRDHAPSMPEEREALAVARTDSEGGFVLKNIGPDGGAIAAWKAGFAPGTVFYEAGENDLVLELRNDLGAVAGKVMLSGQPAANAKVSLLTMTFINLSGVDYSTQTSGTGEFRIGDVPSGEYRLTTWMKQDPAKPLSTKNLTREVAVEAGQDTEVILEIPVGDAAIWGSLLYEHQPPATGFVSVQVETDGGKQDYMAQLDGEGAFRIGGVAAGPARLTAVVSPAVGQTLTHRAEFSVEGGQEMDASADLAPVSTITGVIHGMTPGRPVNVILAPGTIEIVEATFSGVVESTREAVAQVILNGTDSFELPALDPGAYTLIAWTGTPPRRIDGIAVRALQIGAGETLAPLDLTLERP